MEKKFLIDAIIPCRPVKELECDGLINPFVEDDLCIEQEKISIHSEDSAMTPIGNKSNICGHILDGKHNANMNLEINGIRKSTMCVPKLLASDIKERMLAKYIFRVYRGALYFFDGNFYRPLDDDRVHSIMLDEFRNEIKGEKSPKSLTTSALFLICHESQIMIGDDEEMPKNLLACQNGVLDLNRGCMVPPSPQFFLTYRMDFSYVCQPLPTPNFDNFLSFVTGGDQLLCERIYEIIGYCLVPDTAAKKVFVLHGVHDSGKSALIELLEALYPPERVCHLEVDKLSGRFDLANYREKLLCISPDMRDEPLSSGTVSNIKKLTGRDTVTADVKNKAHVSFRFCGKIILLSNFPILLTREDEAFAERVIAVPFLYSVPREQRNPCLPELLKGERDGIASKAVQAYFRLRQRGYAFSGEYVVNDPRIFPEIAVPNDPFDLLEEYIMNRFQQSKDGLLSMAQVYDDFCERIGLVERHKFTTAFLKLAKRVYGAESHRGRPNGETNAVSCVKGISFIF